MQNILRTLRLLLEILLYIITVASAIALIFAYMASVTDPADTSMFIPFGLGAPFIIVINVLLMLLWIIRWKAMAFLPMILLLFGIPVIMRHVQPPFLQQYEKDTEGDIEVMTYNVHIFRDEEWNSSYKRVCDFIKKENPDIVALQEYYSSQRVSSDSLGMLMGNYPYFKSYYIRKDGDHTGYGLGLYSRYKIVRSKEIVFENSDNGAMYADMIIGGDTVRVFNCHLQTTNVDDVDIAFVEGVTSGNDNDVPGKFSRILSKLKSNSTKRASQAEQVSYEVFASPYPVILCGDFNDVPASYTYKTMLKGLKDSFREAGRGYAHSYRDLYGLFNVDYVFYDPKTFHCVYYDSPMIGLSDHDPVIVRVNKNMQ